MKYPSRLVVSTAKPEVIGFIREEDVGRDTAIAGFWIYVYENPKKYSVEEWCADKEQIVWSPEQKKINL